jgi:hypothetical protein
MSINIKPLATNDNIVSVTSATPDLVYTSTGIKTHITAFTVANIGASATTIYVAVLTSAQDASTSGAVAVQSIPAGSTAIIGDVLGHVVPKDGTIEVWSSTTLNLFVSASGFEIP